MPKPELQKYGCPLYGISISGDYAYMCGGGNLGIENKYDLVAFSMMIESTLTF